MLYVKLSTWWNLDHEKPCDNFSRPAFRIFNFPLPNLLKPQNRIKDLFLGFSHFYLQFSLSSISLLLNRIIVSFPSQPPFRQIMSNPITAASSSTTGDITVTSGLGRARTAGIPRNCSCGERIVEVMSKSRPNPYRRFYRCLYAASLRVLSVSLKVHVFFIFT